MAKVKGRYVAQVVLTLEYDEDEMDNMRHFDEIKRDFVCGEMTDMIQALLLDEIIDPRCGTVEVQQTYADLYRVEES